MADHYETLGVSRTADQQEIKAAFRKLAKEHHPDKHGGSDEAKARFQQINEAYQTLSDDNKRAEYDRGPSHGFGGFGGFHTGDGVDFEELLRHAMGGGFRRPTRNHDINVTYQISLEEAFSGKETELSLKINDESRKLKLKVPAGIDQGIRIRYQGQGAREDTNLPPGDLYVHVRVAPHPQFVRNGPHLATSVSINYFDAMLGREVDVPIIEGGNIKLTVPAGIEPGQSLRAVGKGMPVGNNARGDLFIEVVIQSPTLTDEQRKLLEQARDLAQA